MKQVNVIHTKHPGSLLDEAVINNLPAYNPALAAIVRYPDLKFFFVNDAFVQHLGYSFDDLQVRGLSFRDLLQAHQYDHLINQFNNVRDNADARSAFVIYQVKSKDGKQAPYYLYASPIKALQEEYGDLYYLLLHPDLSRWGMPFTSFDSKDMFLEQFRSEYFGTFEWIIDVDKIFCSPGIYQIYEIDQDIEVITNFFAKEFIHPNDKQRVREQTKRALSEDTDLNIEYRIITAKQNVKLIHCLARAIKNSNGKPVKLAGSVRDITEQRAIEESLKNKVAELNQSNRELEEFAYVASHDMQEPLRKITTFSDRLSEKYKDVLTGEGAMYLSRIIASAENMRSLINDLLEFSRISITEQPFEDVNLNAVLRQVKTDLELTIEETGTVVEHDKLPVVHAIGSQMKQLFTNIINNAIKFHKPDVSPVITIESEEVSEEEKLQYELYPNTVYYKVSVTDNGIGFEEEYATRIFQVFQRLHGKSEYPGSGIGLAICKKIIEYHGGTIFAQNLPGKGARFAFILPQLQQNYKGKNP